MSFFLYVRCGLANRKTVLDTRIISGQVTEVSEYPWQVNYLRI